MKEETTARPARSPIRMLLAIGLAVALAGMAFSKIVRDSIEVGGLQAPSLDPMGAVSRSADFRWALVDLDNNPVDFSRFQGKPIVLNLWATWCGPCLREMPSIASLASNPEIKKRGIAVVCVSTDDSAETLREFMKDKKWEMTILRTTSPTSVPPVFQTEGIPATFVIAPDGSISAAEIGAAKWDDPSVITYLQKLAR